MARRLRSSAVAYRTTPPARLREMPAVPPPSTTGTPQRAKLFANGRSQAVRLPKEFRLPGDEVAIRREGDRIILEPLTGGALDAKGWPKDLWSRIDALGGGDDFPDPEPLPARLDDHVDLGGGR